MATWDEIKALASDFKRAQEVSSVNKLSERNCIDIINFLLSDNLIKLHFTVDGKSILTPDELVKEIYEELEVQNHRVTLVSLANTLDIDSKIIETCVNGMVVKDNELQLINNEILLDSSYIRMISLQINDLLKEKCSINMIELTQRFNLPIMFLEKVIQTNQFSIIQAVKEADLIFTEAFIRRYAAIIHGYLTKAATKPIYIYSFIDKQILSEKIIKKIITDAIKAGRLNGTYDSINVTFTPSVFIQNQKDSIETFFERNGYIEYATLAKFGITHASKYLETTFPTGAVIQLSNCAISELLITQVEEALNEVMTNQSLVDCYQIIPFPINGKDLDKLITKIVKKQCKQTGNDAQLLECGYFVHKKFIEKCFQTIEPEIKKRAELYTKQHRKNLVTIFTEESFNKEQQLEAQLDEMSGEAKSGGGKVKKVKYGGGERGREMKNKSVKNKYMIDKKKKPANNNSDETKSDMFEACFQDSEGVEILIDKLQSQDNYTQELIEEIYALIERQIANKFKSECQSIILQTSDTAKNKVEHQKLELKITTLLNKLRIFIKGINEIDEEENEDSEALKRDLKKYHFKSIATDLVNYLFEFVAIDQQLEFDQSTSTNETRTKFISQLKGNLGNHMKNINKTIKDSDNFDDFFSYFETISGQIGIYPKNLDKKSEKRVIQEISAEYHLKVLDKVDDKSKMDPAELLLITLLLLYSKIMGLPIHASGRFVPVLLPFLEKKSLLTKLDWSVLKQYQEYVVQLVKFQGSVEEKDNFKSQNQQLHQSVFDVALNWKGLS